ncbi:hypothetical protein MMC08_007031 [Hypocenomyce scalaris]|nr:hypothetical protein [Hypocenomyce scalaris]
MPLTVPKFKDLPIKEDAPKGSAWGVFDKDDKKDVYGTLNFITPEAVLAAKEEIQTGESVVLNLPLDMPYNPCPGREKNRFELEETHPRLAARDDVCYLNTQTSSQWDGLMHFANQERREYYNGVSYEEAAVKKTDLSLGMHSLSERGGVVARGILVDFVRYAEKRGITYDTLKTYRISLTQLKEMIEDENLTIRQGDVLIVRCGLSKWIRNSKPEDEGPFDINHTHLGVDPSMETIEWIWDSNFSAIAGDALSFECIPATDGTRLKLHGYALPGWGMPIGELFDLEELSRLCEKHKRWSFFLTYCPMNIVGGAATISNTMAIF